jgi:hypothetical protein
MENPMELDEIKERWAQTTRDLEASMRLNTTLLAQWNLRTVDTWLRRLARGIAFELAVNLAAIVVLGAFAAAHADEPRFLLPGIALGVYAIALVIAGARQLVAIRMLDYDESVVAIQKKIEALRILRIRASFWTLAVALLMWLPAAIVVLRGLFGVDLYTAGLAWLIGNAGFGLAVLVLGAAIAKRYGPRLAEGTAMRKVADVIAGRSLSQALAALDSIQRFEDAA